MDASEPINPMSASPEMTAVIVLSAPNGVRNLGADSLNKVNKINGVFRSQVNLPDRIPPESTAVFRAERLVY